MSFHNIQSIELLWTFIAVVGLIFAITNFFYATRSVKRLKGVVPRPDKASWRTARSIQVAETFRFLIQTIHLSIGIAAFFLPPDSADEVPLKFRISVFLIRWGLVASATLTALQSVNSYRLRRYFLTNKDGSSNE